MNMFCGALKLYEEMRYVNDGVIKSFLLSFCFVEDVFNNLMKIRSITVTNM